MNGLLREFTDMVCYVIDVDDTLLDTKRRMQGVWRLTLDKEVPLSDIETSSLEQIFMKHASEEQKGHARELQGKFFSVLLCEDEAGVELASLDQAVPYAAETLQRWATEHELVYLTGRTENTRELTLGSLRRHGFPTDGIPLLMVTLEDWKNRVQTETRNQRLAEIVGKRDVQRVVDEFPGYFTIYSQLQIPERIGLLVKRHEPEHYFEKGATRVVESWKELLDES